MGTSDSADASRDRRLPDEVVADILDSDQRRYALQALSREKAAMTVNDLAAVVRAAERDTSPDAVEQGERRRVREEFFQRHLPKLTAVDAVRYDSVLGTVELTDRESFADALEER